MLKIKKKYQSNLRPEKMIIKINVTSVIEKKIRLEKI